MLKSLNRLGCAGLVLCFVGCVNQPQPQTQPVIISAPDTTEVPIEAPSPVTTPQQTITVAPVAPPSSHGAVDSLIKQARSQYFAQDYQNAIATAERGLRIDRRAADLYLVLAQSYIQLALPQKAKMFVQQGLRYAPQDSDTANSLLRAQDVLGN
jgi:tetratricopeptide (TPR) repeat protein